VPDLPVQRIQIRSPVPVGEVRSAGENGIEVAVRAAERLHAGGYDFAAYAAARSPSALAEILDGWVAGEKSA
ncbi:MAG: hypothetical protein U1E27_06575, partial [Kiritimatiellia bacterium]|nr:hypothetical protein [Kiritimatiellia bacterium]